MSPVVFLGVFYRRFSAGGDGRPNRLGEARAAKKYARKAPLPKALTDINR